MRGRSRGAVIGIAACLLLLGTVVSPAAAAPRGAVLDPTFGDGGVLRLPAESASVASGVATGDGGLLVSPGRSVQSIDGLGVAGEAFGGVGSAAALAGAPGHSFVISDLDFDSFGRLLVLGESLFPESENPSPPLDGGGQVFEPGVVRILRFLPDGALDPTFGQAGIVETDLGLPPPRDLDGNPLGSHPAIEPTGITTDPRGRIIITGGAIVRLDDSCPVPDRLAPAADSAGFVARFEEDGELDRSLGKGGLVGGRGVRSSPLGAALLADPVTNPVGGITVRVASAYTCGVRDSHLGLARLTPDGPPSRGFGENGVLLGPYTALVTKPAGTIYALAVAPRPRPDKEDFRARLISVDESRSGPLDPNFGSCGRVALRLGRRYGTTLDSLAFDGHGHILVGGRIGIGASSSLVLLRVSKDGRWERSFGPHGRIVTPMPGLVEYGGADMFRDAQGRLVVVRLYSGSPSAGGSGLVIARYLLRS